MSFNKEILYKYIDIINIFYNQYLVKEYNILIYSKI